VPLRDEPIANFRGGVRRNELVDDRARRELDQDEDQRDHAPDQREREQQLAADVADEIDGIDKRFKNTQIDLLSGIHNLYKWEVPPDKVKYK
jgi:hypothetical protein